jgi:Cu(I)/Ag(I) efflux system membrane protein CusA/SilA
VLVPLHERRVDPAGASGEGGSCAGTGGIRTENALLAAYIFVDARERDLGSYVADAKKAVAASVKFPPGYYAIWSGQFEFYERAPRSGSPSSCR